MTRTLKEKVEFVTGIAERLVAEYEQTVGGDELLVSVGDLIADLLLFAEREGSSEQEIEDMLATASEHWRYERDPANADESA